MLSKASLPAWALGTGATIVIFQQGQRDDKGAATPFFAHNLYGAAVKRDQFFDDVQSNTQPTDLAFVHIRGTIKALEQQGKLGLGDTHPRVTDSNANRRIVAFNLNEHCAGRAIFDGIVHQVR